MTGAHATSVAYVAAARLERALRPHREGGQDQHLCDVDRLVQLGGRNLAGIPIEQPHVRRLIDDDRLGGESAVRDST